MQTANPHFRSDIEGMRAIAILLVIGAHFAIPGFAAGFIGVDIFFVLSGFLITGILVREYQTHQRINLSRFYANRFRRLFPALATMLLVSSLVAAQILPDTQNLAQSKAAAMSAIWLSNIHFTFADVDYFAAETSTNAFVHTWSLGVEEQFYLLWPLIILATLTLFTRSQQSTKPLWVTLLAIAGISLLACLHLSSVQPLFAFYMMPTRAWQFAAGGMVWLLAQQKTPTKTRSVLSGLASLQLLSVALLLIGPASTYPGLYALLPTLATCTLLWAGNNTLSATYKVLSLPPLLWIGRISYSWYLWHWPVLILGEHLLPIRGDCLNTLAGMALSLMLAVMTHHLIENPVRFGRVKKLQPRWQICAALVFMVLFNSQLLRWYNNTQSSLNSSTNNYASAMSDIPSFYRDGCDDWFHSDELKPCRYGNESTKKTAVLLGDSIGAQWFNTLTELYNPNEWALIVITKSSCPMVDEPYFYQRIGREYSECRNWRSKALAWIAEQKPDAVFVGGTASSEFTDEQWTHGSQKILDKLSLTASKVYLIEANPTLGFNGPECLMQHQQKNPQKCTQGTANNSGYAHVASLLESLTRQYDNVGWIETASFVCPHGQCSAMQGEQVVFRDSQHLTGSFTSSASKHFAKQMIVVK